MKTVGIVSIFFWLMPLFAVAQGNWSVNSSNYEFSMNITGIVKIDHAEINTSGTWLAAFSGGECRGLSQSTELQAGGYAYFLTIYSNTAQGEKISFKLMDSSEEITEFADTVLFVPDAIYGSPENPFLWALPQEFAPTDFLSFSTDFQVGETQIDTANHSIELSVTDQADIENLVSYYTVPAGAKVFVGGEPQQSGVSANDFSSPLNYTVQGTNGKSSIWEVNVLLSSGIEQPLPPGVSVVPTLMVRNFCMLTTPEALTYRLFDPYGRHIANGKALPGKTKIPIPPHTHGILFLQLKVQNQQWTKKLFKP